jgi:hypothetical protein
LHAFSASSSTMPEDVTIALVYQLQYPCGSGIASLHFNGLSRKHLQQRCLVLPGILQVRQELGVIFLQSTELALNSRIYRGRSVASCLLRSEAHRTSAAQLLQQRLR